MSARAVPAFWTGAIILALIGLAASAGRTISVVDGLRGPQPAPELSRLDEYNTRGLAMVLGVRPGTREYEDGMAQIRRFLGKFNRYPVTTLLHVVPAALFALLAPFQFSRRIRSRHIRVHRWSGRVLVAIAIPIGLTGLFFGLFVPFAGLLEASGVAVFGALFLFAVVRAVVAIRRKDIATHREWMIRMFAIAIGVSTVRLVGFPLLLLTRKGPEAWFGHSIWLGFGLTLVAAELWIAATRRRPAAPAIAVALLNGQSLPAPRSGTYVGT